MHAQHCLCKRDTKRIDLSAKAHHNWKVWVCVNTQCALPKTLRLKSSKH